MVARITSSYIRFHAPFNLKGYKETLPSGRYKVEAEEILIKGLSFTALRRVQLRVELQKDAKRPNTTETLVLDNPQDLYAALAKDKASYNRAVSKGLKETFRSIRGARFDADALERAEGEGMF